MTKAKVKHLWLGDRIEYEGPLTFSASDIAESFDPFADRHALFYTPSASIPRRWLGSGELDVTLPIATPSYFECIENRVGQSPRMWVDLLQRATRKLRWLPIDRAKVIITRFEYGSSHGPSMAGTKGLIDALKVSTSGRSDRKLLYYFGAILDDSSDHIDLEFNERRAKTPSEARTRVQVQGCGLSLPRQRPNKALQLTAR
jgi:hypothetical protein